MGGEIVFSISPPDFYTLAEGYVYYKDLQKLLNKLDFEVFEIVTNDKLSEMCSGVKKITSRQLTRLMEESKNLIKR